MFQSIRARLTALSFISCLFLVVAGEYGVYQLGAANDRLGANLKDISAGARAQQTAEEAALAFKVQVQEWKNILIRGNDPAQFDKYRKQFGDEEAKVQDRLSQVLKYFEAGQGDVAVVRVVIDEHKRLGERYREALKQFDAADPNAGKKVDALVKGMDRAPTQAMTKLVENIKSAERGHLDEQMKLAEDTHSRVAVISRVVIAVAAVLSLGLMLWMSGRITRSVTALEETASRVRRDWNLSLRAPVMGDDELARCATQVNDMLAAFQEVVAGVRGAAQDVAASAEQVAAANGSLSGSVAEQNESTAATAAAVEQLAVSVGHVKDRAMQANEISARSAELAARGGEVIENATRRMLSMGESVKGSTGIAEAMDEHAREIGGIVQIIKELADQTNLLALNAAIEAARAGEQGRGFAVVADEVRQLAERTTQATQKIATVIEKLESSSRESVDNIRGVVDQVRQVTTLAGEAGSSVVEIREGAARVSGLFDEIAAALSQQAAASDSIARQIEAIANRSEENGAALREASLSAEHLKGVSHTMNKAVARFS